MSTITTSGRISVNSFNPSAAVMAVATIASAFENRRWKHSRVKGSSSITRKRGMQPAPRDWSRMIADGRPRTIRAQDVGQGGEHLLLLVRLLQEGVFLCHHRSRKTTRCSQSARGD